MLKFVTHEHEEIHLVGKLNEMHVNVRIRAVIVIPIESRATVKALRLATIGY